MTPKRHFQSTDEVIDSPKRQRKKFVACVFGVSFHQSGSNLELVANDVIPIRSNALGASPVPSASSLDVPTSVNMSLAIGK